MNYIIENDILKVEISSRGGELQSIVRDGAEYLWQADPVYWDEKAPNLFPYIGRMTQGKYTVKGKEYKMPIHGFLPSTELQCEEQSRDRIVFRVDANEATKSCYPFSFTYRVIYELDGEVLRVIYLVMNQGEETMYFGIGGHPGIAVPVGGSENGKELKFEDYYLEFSGQTEVPVRVDFSPTCFLTGDDKPFELEEGKYLHLHHDMFDQDAIVLRNTSGTVVLKSDRGEHYVRVCYPDMAYIGFWHAVKTDAPYICIEPWSSLPSRQDVVEELAEQPGLIALPAGKSYRNAWSMEIH